MLHLHDVEKLRLIPLCTHWGLTLYLYSLKGLKYKAQGSAKLHHGCFIGAFYKRPVRTKVHLTNRILVLLPLQGASLSTFTRPKASLAIGLCTHWAFSPFSPDTNNSYIIILRTYLYLFIYRANCIWET